MSPGRNPTDSDFFIALFPFIHPILETFPERSGILTEGNLLVLIGVPLAIIALAVISYFLVGKEDPDDESFDEKGLS